MNYTLHQLRVFLKIAQVKSITKASQELHLTQPAVSIQLKSFQEQFDIPLTEVVGRQLYVTDFGIEIAEAAEKILNEVNAINFKTMAYKGQITGRLKISVVSTGKYVMPYFLTGLLKKHPAIELVMDVTNKAKVIESLEKNEVDFSLVSILPELQNIRYLDLLQNKLYLVANREQAYRSKPYDTALLEKLPIIFREPGSGTRYAVEKFILDNKLTIQKNMELTSNEAVKQAVIAGLGASIMPLIGLKNELNNGGLQIIPVKKFPIKSTWRIIWNKSKRFSPVAEAFLHYLRLEKENIIAEKFEWYEKY
jgi:DNA-binding transcriptional LysR family regulator